MKRLVTLFIALIYLVMSTGFVMNSHYCMGKLSSIELGVSEAKKCICGMRIDSAKKNKCCHSKIEVVKLEDSHKLTTSAVVFPNFIATVYHSFMCSLYCLQVHIRQINILKSCHLIYTSKILIYVSEYF